MFIFMKMKTDKEQHNIGKNLKMGLLIILLFSIFYTVYSKNKIEGIVHDVSATSKTFYIEQKQIVPLNNKIREVNSKIRAEIISILIELTRGLKDNIQEIKNSISILSEIDFHFAKVLQPREIQLPQGFKNGDSHRIA